MKYGFLGPKGTFSHSAAAFFAKNNETIPYSSIYNALLAAKNGEVDYAVVPIENSTEGSVNTALDSLIFDFDMPIKAQLNLPISESLVAKSDTSLEEITKVLSHTQPFAQCSDFLRKKLPFAETVSVSSTAEAMRLVSESDEKLAAIGNKLSAPLYGLDVLREHIENDDKNFTIFALVSPKKADPDKGAQKTTIAFSVLNEPGNLFKILSIFSIYDVNMTKILSRPMRNRPEEYVFFVDLENGDKKDIEDAMTMVRRKTSFFKLLGSYNVYDLRQ